MRFKYLIAAAIVIVGVAAYTLTLSFTQTTLLMSQIEALANGEGGESGDGGGTGEETGGENPESGGGKQGYTMKEETHYCQEYRWVQVSDGSGGHNWELKRIGNGTGHVRVTKCINGGDLTSCTPYDPCNPAKPTI